MCSSITNLDFSTKFNMNTENEISGLAQQSQYHQCLANDYLLLATKIGYRPNKCSRILPENEVNNRNGSSHINSNGSSHINSNESSYNNSNGSHPSFFEFKNTASKTIVPNVHLVGCAAVVKFVATVKDNTYNHLHAENLNTLVYVYKINHDSFWCLNKKQQQKFKTIFFYYMLTLF